VHNVRRDSSAERQGTEIITADVTRVDFSARPFRIWVGDTLEPTLAKTVIIATGARANYLGLRNEHVLKNKGVSVCAVCDGALFRGKPVAVVGGGDTAMEEASYLAGVCPSVTLIIGVTSFAPRKCCKTVCARIRASRCSAATKCATSTTLLPAA
jgi:thioredoxin reductase (NADPH)